MDASCERQFAPGVVKNASATMARPSSSAGARTVAYGGLLGARWTKVLTKEESTHVLSGLVRRGLATPATEQMETKLRAGLFEISGSIGGDVDVDSASWRSFIETKGLLQGACKQGMG